VQRFHQVTISVVTVLLVAVAVVAFHGWSQSAPDVRVYWDASLRLREALPLYGAQAFKQFIYPPTFAAAFAPFTWLTPTWGYALWMALQFLLLRGLLGLLSSLGGLDAARGAAFTSQCAWVLVLPVVGGLIEGQANLLVLVVLTAGLLALREDQDVLGGLLLGLAVQLKVYPVVLLPLLVLLGRTRAARWMSAGTALATGLPLVLSVLLHGVTHGLTWWLDAHRAFLEQVLLPALGDGNVAGIFEYYSSNYSVRAVLHRLFSSVPFRPMAGVLHGPLVCHVPSVVLGAVSGLVTLSMVLMAASLAPRVRGRNQALVPAAAVVLCAAQLGSPTFWEHHLVGAALLLLCGHALPLGYAAWRWRAAAVLTLGLTMTLPLLLQLAGEVTGNQWSSTLTAMRDTGAPLAGVLMLWWSVMLQLWGLSRSNP